MTRKQQESARIPTQRECDALTCDCIKQCKRIYPPSDSSSGVTEGKP